MGRLFNSLTFINFDMFNINDFKNVTNCTFYLFPPIFQISKWMQSSNEMEQNSSEREWIPLYAKKLLLPLHMILICTWRLWSYHPAFQNQKPVKIKLDIVTLHQHLNFVPMVCFIMLTLVLILFHYKQSKSAKVTCTSWYLILIHSCTHSVTIHTLILHGRCNICSLAFIEPLLELLY